MSNRKKEKPWEAQWQKVVDLDSGGQGKTELVVPKGSPVGTTAQAVLKILSNNKDRDRRSRMAREVEALQHLSHPQIPRFIESNAEGYRNSDEPLYVVLEYIPGSTLTKRVEAVPLKVEESFSLLHAILDVVEYCHSRGVVHRDIKPDNIILRNNDPADPVLVDFGLSYGTAIHTNATPTLAGQQLGNRFLHLPELQGPVGDKRDPRSDLTQCCGILFYVLTGIVPVNLVDENNQQPHQRPDGRLALANMTSQQLELLSELFDTGFKVQIDDRFQSGEELRELLRRAVDRKLAGSEHSQDGDGGEDEMNMGTVLPTREAYDEMIVPGASLEDLDPDAIAAFRRLHERISDEPLDLGETDEDLLYGLCAASKQNECLVPTRAGLLVFGKRLAIRRYFSLMRIDYIRMEGREWVPDPENRGWHVEILDSLLRAIPRAIQQIMDDIPRAFHLPRDEVHRQEIPLLPKRALEELVVNAVMHRDYRLKSPIQIIRYADRLEIRNPGFSLVPHDELGKPGSKTRNEKVAAILHDTPYAETKGSGIRAVRNLMKDHDLEPPVFESDAEADTFVVTVLFHHLLSKENLDWLQEFQQYDLSSEDQKALLIVRDVGFINGATYKDINSVDAELAQRNLQRLVDLRLLSERKQGSETRYVRGSALVHTSGEAVPDQHQTRDLPEGLLARIKGIDRKTSESVVEDLILGTCAIRPMSAQELANLFGHTARHMKNRYLRPLVASGRIGLSHPESLQHPQQAYRTLIHPAPAAHRTDG